MPPQATSTITRAERRDFDRGVEMHGERRARCGSRRCVTLPSRQSARTRIRPAGRLERQLGDRLDHRDHPGLEQRRRHADGVGAGHRRILDLLHDHEAGVGVGVRGRQHQVAVRRWIAARLAQHALPQPVLRAAPGTASSRTSTVPARRGRRRQSRARARRRRGGLPQRSSKISASPVARCPLPVACCLLPVACCLLPDTRCPR